MADGLSDDQVRPPRSRVDPAASPACRRGRPGQQEPGARTPRSPPGRADARAQQPTARPSPAPPCLRSRRPLGRCPPPTRPRAAPTSRQSHNLPRPQTSRPAPPRPPRLASSMDRTAPAPPSTRPPRRLSTSLADPRHPAVTAPSPDPATSVPVETTSARSPGSIREPRSRERVARSLVSRPAHERTDRPPPRTAARGGACLGGLPARRGAAKQNRRARLLRSHPQRASRRSRVPRPEIGHGVSKVSDPRR